MLCLSPRCPPPRLLAVAAEPDVRQISPGLFYNERFSAHNVWEIDVDTDLVDEAASIYYDGLPFASLQQPGEPYADIMTNAGNFFAHRVNWESDIAWSSADDERAFDVFSSIFSRLNLAERFAAMVPHGQTLRMYNAFFVSRSKCDDLDFHADYFNEVGTDALTLITPLRDFREVDSFQLAYMPSVCDGGEEEAAAADDERSVGASAATATASSKSAVPQQQQQPRHRRYQYKKGKAVVFGSRFLHSTEPGCGHDGEVHAYLCFTFGTDDQSAWPRIERTLGTQSRIVRNPDGELRLSTLGREIERLLRESR